jgi:hypothetical protein
MNVRIWKRAAGGPYKKNRKREIPLGPFTAVSFPRFYRGTPVRVVLSYLPVPISGFIIWDAGMSLLLQGLLLPLVAHQNYKLLIEVVVLICCTLS